MKTITSVYRGATDTRPARILVSDEDGNKVVQAWDHELDTQENHDAAAIALCVKMDWVAHDLVRGATKTGYVYVFDAPGERVKYSPWELGEAARLRARRTAKS